jgi:hypothetical protein
MVDVLALIHPTVYEKLYYLADVTHPIQRINELQLLVIAVTRTPS